MRQPLEFIGPGADKNAMVRAGIIAKTSNVERQKISVAKFFLTAARVRAVAAFDRARLRASKTAQ
jgi:hypothetical protein